MSFLDSIGGHGIGVTAGRSLSPGVLALPAGLEPATLGFEVWED